MILVEEELKEIFEKAHVQTFFDALAYLLHAGYSDLEAFSNATYFFPNDITSSIVRANVETYTDDAVTNLYKFKLYKQKLDNIKAVPHLKAFIKFCVDKRLDVGLPKDEIEFSLRNEAIYSYLVDKLSIKEIIINVSRVDNSLPF